MSEQHAITALSEIPPLVNTFAADAGWTVTGTSASPIVTRAGGDKSFQLVDATGTLTWTGTDGSARVLSPKLNGTASTPEISDPSKVYLFGDDTFIAIVIEYAFNSYRHLYCGNLEKAGTYDGGEVISGCTPLTTASVGSFPLSYRDAQYLFNGRQTINAANLSGGVNLPDGWRKFRTTSSAAPMGNFDATGVIGGFLDDINDGYLARGRSAYAGAQILVPINLYAPMPITGDTLFAPLGHPAGVRMVNMADIDPAATFTIGSTTWQCFPAMTKTAATTVAQGTGGGWAASDTSYYIGYAYPQ